MTVSVAEAVGRTGAEGEGGVSLFGLAGSKAEYLLFAIFLVAALAVRAPGYLFSELNLDEALYLMIGESLLNGHLPYSEFWDRKPVGIFVFTAAVQAVLGGDIMMLRLVTSAFAGTTAYLLSILGRILFPSLPYTGIVAGVFYILYSMSNGGDGTNTEVIFTPIYLTGAIILLRIPAGGNGPVAAPAFLAGLLAGAALQIKYVVIFDILAFAAIYVIAAMKTFGAKEWRRFLTIALWTGLGVCLPTLAVMLWYAAAGEFELFYASNIVANRSLVAQVQRPFGVSGLVYGVQQYGIVFALTSLTLISGPLLCRGPTERRGWFAIAAWLSAMSLSLWFLIRFADHFFIQTLPALSMAAAWFLMQAGARLPKGRIAQPAALAAVLVLVAALAERSQISTAIETIKMRYGNGIPHWGDRSATTAAALRGRLSPADEIYVYGRPLGVYAAAGRRPPTRYPFTEHLWADYSPANGAGEIGGILKRRPAFVIAHDQWLPGGTPDAEREPIGAVLFEALEKDYVLDGRVSRFRSTGGGFVGGGVGVTVFRRRDVAPFQPDGKLQYEPGE